MTYSEKLRDPRWQRKRLEIMQRDEFACRACGNKENTLNVHHLEYSGNPWDAENDSLVTLCQNCHADAETVKKLKNVINDGFLHAALMQASYWLMNTRGKSGSFFRGGDFIIMASDGCNNREKITKVIERLQAALARKLSDDET